MKKITVLICLVFLSLPVFAQYKPIPPNLSKQYKFEIDKIIKQQTSKSIKTFDKEFNKIQAMYNAFLKQKENVKTLTDKQSLCDGNLWYDLLESRPKLDLGELQIYQQVVKKTAQYVKIDLDYILSTDFPSDAATFLVPYFKDNYINLYELEKYLDYSENKIQKYRAYMQDMNMYCTGS